MCNCGNSDNKWCITGNLEHLCFAYIINGNVFVAYEDSLYKGLLRGRFVGKENSGNNKLRTINIGEINYG